MTAASPHGRPHPTPPPPGTAISIRALGKTFATRRGLFRTGPPKVAVASVDLDVAEGELFVLLGRNGAGKTTLVKMLATLVLPSTGHAAIFGHDIEREGGAVRSLIGLGSPDERSFFWRLSGRENLAFFGALHGLTRGALAARIDEISARLDLGEFLDRRFDGYSSGMKQRLALGRSLIGRPRLLFLDEPTRSLDPSAQRQTRELVKTLRREGLTILLVTHQLDEARELADRIGVMEDGHLRLYQPGAVDLEGLFA